MKTISHLDGNISEYKPTKARYFCEGDLLLNITDSVSDVNIGERVNIDGVFYRVSDATFYPELIIWDFDLTKEEK